MFIFWGGGIVELMRSLHLLDRGGSEAPHRKAGGFRTTIQSTKADGNILSNSNLQQSCPFLERT